MLPSSLVPDQSAWSRVRVGRIRTEVLFVDDSIMVDHESHHARVRILGRISNDREAADRAAFDCVIVSAAGALAPCPFSKGSNSRDRARPTGSLIALARRRDATSVPSGLGGSPAEVGQYKPSFLPGVLANFVAYSGARSPSRSRDAYSRCASTIASSTFMTASSFSPTRRASSSALPALASKRQPEAVLTSGIGERKVVRINRQCRALIAVGNDRVLRFIASDEALGYQTVVDGIAGRERARGVFAQHREYCRAVTLFHRLHQCSGGFFGAGKSTLRGCRRERC